ncbi:MAG: GspMb/PilO family protein [Bryobacteraceae bacterium]|nr:GspMb/PilO family protein [Bryobacteraceae bacterium]MCX7603350.1 GspMb/PilO family protein [Bryobacteraceae bacterium]
MKMPPLSDRDRRALALLAVCSVVFLAVYFWPEGGAAPVVGPAVTVEQMEQRIRKLRRMAAAAPGREEALKKVRQELGQREQGMLRAETAAQAQAQMLELVRRVAKSQPESFALKGAEFGQPRALGDAYAEIVMTVIVECPVEQLLAFLADVSNQPELIAISEVQLSQAAGNRKIIPARLTFTGVAPRSLAPEKKGGRAF